MAVIIMNLVRELEKELKKGEGATIDLTNIIGVIDSTDVFDAFNSLAQELQEKVMSKLPKDDGYQFRLKNGAIIFIKYC